DVKRTVWQRDGGQCTFVSEAGQRCPARTLLEYDHVDPVARGGEASVAGIRLRCRGHNQYAAECAFGMDFMETKRQQARCAAQARSRTMAVESRATAADSREAVLASREAEGRA